MSTAVEQAAELFKVLSAPARLLLLLALEDGPRCVHELTDTLGISQPLVSQHLRVLRQADLVHADKRGRETAYSIADDHISHIVRDALAHTEEHSHDRR